MALGVSGWLLMFFVFFFGVFGFLWFLCFLGLLVFVGGSVLVFLVLLGSL